MNTIVMSLASSDDEPKFYIRLLATSGPCAHIEGALTSRLNYRELYTVMPVYSRV